MTLEETVLVENILRTARKGCTEAERCMNGKYCDLFQHIIDESERLLVPNHPLLNKE